MIPDLLIVLALILGNGLFAGAEIAILTVRKGRLHDQVVQGSRSALAVQELRRQPERFLATVQIGITVVGATSAVYGGEFIASRVSIGLRRMGVEDYAEEISFAAVVAAISYLSLVVGELVPKSLALRHADRYSSLIGRPLLVLSVVMRPLVWFLTASSNVILRLFGDKTSFTEARVSRQELQHLVDEAVETGSIDRPSSEIATRAIAFGEVSVAQLMVPRSEIVALPMGVGAEEVRRLLLEEGHSRMPVFRDSLDTVLGYVVAKDVLAVAWERPLIIFEDIIRPVYFVDGSERAAKVLRGLQRRKMQLAIVQDASGAVVGLVTAEDLVEELVGEIFSEDEREPMLREIDGSILAEAAVPVREINREFGLDLDAGDSTTIGELYAARAGTAAAPGHAVLLDDGRVLEIEEAPAGRIEVVRIRPPR